MCEVFIWKGAFHDQWVILCLEQHMMHGSLLQKRLNLYGLLMLDILMLDFGN